MVSIKLARSGNGGSQPEHSGGLTVASRDGGGVRRSGRDHGGVSRGPLTEPLRNGSRWLGGFPCAMVMVLGVIVVWEYLSRYVGMYVSVAPSGKQRYQKGCRGTIRFFSSKLP